jgi:curved DNA-binding protein
MASEDYYSILGLSRDATKDDIRSAHRRLARELHPDMNKAPDAAKKFAKVQEAYDTLSDEEKRKVYDRVGHDAFVATGGAPGGGGGGWPGGGGGRRGGGQTYTWTNAGGAPHSDPFNQQDIGDIFEEMFGVRPEAPRGRARPGARRAQTQRPEPPEDIEQEVVIPFDLMLTGGKWDVTTPSGETIEVAIPKGVNDNARLRLRGKGGSSRMAAPGDLLLRIRVAPHPRYERTGNDITATLPLSIVEATLGGKVAVRTPGDGHVDLTVPAGTPSGAKMRIRGKGVETAKGQRGDFYAVVKIVPPKDLSDEDRAALEALGERIGRPERE